MEKATKRRLQKENVPITPETVVYDEIQMIREMSCITALEAMWIIRKYPLSQCSHVVTALSVHEQNEESVLFEEGLEEQALERLVSCEATSAFTAWMKLNQVIFKKKKNFSFPGE